MNIGFINDLVRQMLTPGAEPEEGPSFAERQSLRDRAYKAYGITPGTPHYQLTPEQRRIVRQTGEQGLQQPDLDPIEIATDLALPIKGAAKVAARMGASAMNRRAMAKAIPGMKDVFDEMGNPLTNIPELAMEKLRGKGKEFMDRLPTAQPQLQPAGVMAEKPLLAEGPLKRTLRDRVAGSWAIDVPYRPTDEAVQPWMVVPESEGAMAAFRSALSGRPIDQTQPSRGVYSGLKLPGTQSQWGGDIAGVVGPGKDRSLNEALQTVKHELFHNTIDKLRGYPGRTEAPEQVTEALRRRWARGFGGKAPVSREGTEDYLADVWRKAPQRNRDYIDRGYASRPEMKRGEELLARFGAGQRQPWSTLAESPTYQSLSKLYSHAVHPDLPAWMKRRAQRDLMAPTFQSAVPSGYE